MENIGQKHRPHIKVGKDVDKEEGDGDIPTFASRDICLFFHMSFNASHACFTSVIL